MNKEELLGTYHPHREYVSTFARLGKCDKDACTFQHVSSGQLRKALGNEPGDQKGGHERQHSEGSGPDGSKGARGGKSKSKSFYI